MLSASNAIAKQLPTALLYTTLGVGLKAIGSAFRVKDLDNAPQAVQGARINQEAALLGLAGAVTLGAQALLPLAFGKFGITGEFGKNLARSAMIAPGYIASEALSRKFGNVSWDGMMENSGLQNNDAPARTMLRQLTDFLFQPNTDTSAQAFGNSASSHALHNPYNRSAASLAAPAMVGQRLDTTSAATTPALNARLLPFSGATMAQPVARPTTSLTTPKPFHTASKGSLQI